MKTVTINVISKHLDCDADCMLMPDKCAGYKAVHEKIPSLISWSWHLGYVLYDNQYGRLAISVVEEQHYYVSNKLIKHFQYLGTNGKEGIKAEPFSFDVTVPDDVEVVE